MIKNVGEIVDKLFIDSLEPGFESPGRDYLSWVMDRVQGQYVLDVCSYNGIFSILLKNINIKVDTVLAEIPSIESMEGLLPKYQEAQQFYDQYVNNPEKTEIYDSIMVIDPQRWGMNIAEIIQIVPYLKMGGRIIITTKFGKFGMDVEHVDYGFDLVNLTRAGYQFEDADIIGKSIENVSYYWLCTSFIKSDQSSNLKNEDKFLARLNELIANKECEYTNLLKMESEKSNNDILNTNSERMRIALELKNIQDNLYSIYNQISPSQYLTPIEIVSNDEKIEENVDSLIAFNVENRSSLINESEESLRIEILRSKLEEAIKLLKNELDEEEKLLTRCAELQKKLERAEHRYSTLANSTPGKLTLSYWKFLKNVK